MRSYTLLAVFLLTASLACGTTITFEGQENTIYNSPIVRSGFTIGNVLGDEQHFHEITSTNYGLPNNGTGILLNDRNTRIFVDFGGSTFTLTSVDVATALNNNPAVGMTITGYLSGNPTGSVILASLGSGYTTLSGAPLGNVDTLIFDGTGGDGGFVLDNLTLNEAGPGPIPEPATISLIGAGLLSLAFLRRRF